MALPKNDNEVPQVSAQTATLYVQKMVRLEEIHAGTKERAIDNLANRYGLTPSQLVHLYKAKAKKCDVGLFVRIKQAYYDKCARMIAALQHEMAFEEAIHGDAHDQDLADRLTALATEVAAQKAALRQGAR